MTGYEFGDIVLIPFPFTDQSSTKRRPAVIISSVAYHRSRHDVIVMAITSQPNPVTAFGEVAVQDWQPAGLLKPSVIKPVLTTIDPKLVIKKLGRLSSADQAALRQVLASLLG